MSWFAEFALYAGTGRVLIYLIQKFPLKHFIKSEFLDELVECDMCLGVYVYIILAYMMKINIFNKSKFGKVLTGAITSFVMHLLRIGWNDKFGTIYLEG